VIILLVVGMTGTILFPLVHWHKYSGEYSQEMTESELRIVDANGNELEYVDRALLGVGSDGPNMDPLVSEFRECEAGQNRAIAQYMLRAAQDYRNEVATRSIVRRVRFPPHVLHSAWTPSELRSHDRFVGIRLYEITVTTSATGDEFTSRSDRLMFAYSAANDSTVCRTEDSRD
jgi:hypothetical protein